MYSKTGVSASERSEVTDGVCYVRLHQVELHWKLCVNIDVPEKSRVRSANTA